MTRADPVGHISVEVLASEDGTTYVMSCPCGWEQSGASTRRAKTHLKTCPYAVPEQTRLLPSSDDPNEWEIA